MRKSTAAPTALDSRVELTFTALGAMVVIIVAVAAAMRRGRRRPPQCAWPVDEARRGRGRSKTYPVDKKGDVAEVREDSQSLQG